VEREIKGFFEKRFIELKESSISLDDVRINSIKKEDNQSTTTKFEEEEIKKKKQCRYVMAIRAQVWMN